MVIPLSTRLHTAIPATLEVVANRAAAILDPDTGGGKTYTTAYTATIDGVVHYCADLPIWPITPGEYPALDAIGITDYGQIMRSRNPTLWSGVLSQLATERGRQDTFAQLSSADIVALCTQMKFNEEIKE